MSDQNGKKHAWNDAELIEMQEYAMSQQMLNKRWWLASDAIGALRIREIILRAELAEKEKTLFAARQSIIKEGLARDVAEKKVKQLVAAMVCLLKSSDTSWYTGKHGGHDWREAVDEAHLLLVKIDRREKEGALCRAREEL